MLTVIECAACGARRQEHTPLDADGLGLEGWLRIGPHWTCRAACQRAIRQELVREADRARTAEQHRRLRRTP